MSQKETYYGQPKINLLHNVKTKHIENFQRKQPRNYNKNGTTICKNRNRAQGDEGESRGVCILW